MDWNTLAENVDAVCVATFADASQVTYTHESEAPPVTTTYTAAFSAASERIVLEGGVPFSSTSPTLGVHLADLLHTPKQGDKVVRGGVDYWVEDFQQDNPGVGMTLILSTDQMPST